MPKGQSQTTWFPELKEILKQQWKEDLSIKEHFELVNKLNKKLSEIRIELQIKPPMFWCKHCKTRHASKFNMVTITAMYYALERFEICTSEKHLALKRNWKKYSKEHSIDIRGQLKKNTKV